MPASEATVIEVADWFGHRPANLYSDDPGQPTIGNIRVDPSVPVATNQCHFLGPHTDQVDQVVENILCSVARVNAHRMRKGDLEPRDWDNLTNAAIKQPAKTN